MNLILHVWVVEGSSPFDPPSHKKHKRHTLNKKISFVLLVHLCDSNKFCGEAKGILMVNSGKLCNDAANDYNHT